VSSSQQTAVSCITANLNRLEQDQGAQELYERVLGDALREDPVGVCMEMTNFATTAIRFLAKRRHTTALAYMQSLAVRMASRPDEDEDEEEL